MVGIRLVRLVRTDSDFCSVYRSTTRTNGEPIAERRGDERGRAVTGTVRPSAGRCWAGTVVQVRDAAWGLAAEVEFSHDAAWGLASQKAVRRPAPLRFAHSLCSGCFARGNAPRAAEPRPMKSG